MNRVVGFESLNAMGDLSRFVGSRSPIANQAQGRAISNRKNASAFAGRSVIAEGVFFVEPVADHVWDPGRKMARQESIQRIVFGFGISGTASAKMRRQSGMQHPVKIPEIFALAGILVAAVLSHGFSSILARYTA